LLQSDSQREVLKRLRHDTLRNAMEWVAVVRAHDDQVGRHRMPLAPLITYVTAESGMGKSSLAKSVAAELNIPLIICSGSDLHLPNAMPNLLRWLSAMYSDTQAVLLIDEFEPPTHNADPFAEAMCMFLDQVNVRYTQINRRADCVQAPSDLMWCRPGRVMRITLPPPTLADVQRLAQICYQCSDFPEDYVIPKTFAELHEQLRTCATFDEFVLF
jgi:hypothetical protein